MANDRIWIRCRQCQKKLLLAKYYPSTSLSPLCVSADKLVSFIEEHLDERDAEWWKEGLDLEGEPGFEFITDDAKYHEKGKNANLE